MFGGLSVITVLIAVDQLNAGEAGTGYLNAAVGVGGVLGAIGAGAILARRNLAPAMLVGALGLDDRVHRPRLLDPDARPR